MPKPSIDFDPLPEPTKDTMMTFMATAETQAIYKSLYAYMMSKGNKDERRARQEAHRQLALISVAHLKGFAAWRESQSPRDEPAKEGAKHTGTNGHGKKTNGKGKDTPQRDPGHGLPTPIPGAPPPPEEPRPTARGADR